ncbi:hypothetical protein TUN199_02146 [Pyrenophora tritici-repentis]|nr:hypothetical protein A1F99_063700 [Pyrenophora tritici-repentis]KAI0625854.1 hypothetical protein TUN199_02146 [Pyrenophora tritici-repentis]
MKALDYAKRQKVLEAALPVSAATATATAKKNNQISEASSSQKNYYAPV